METWAVTVTPLRCGFVTRMRAPKRGITFLALVTQWTETKNLPF